MKNNHRYFPIFIAFVFLQLFSNNLLGQISMQTETQSKCDRCAEYLNNNNMTEYAAENCRAYSSICTALSGSAVVIGDNLPDGKIDFETGTTTQMIIFIDGFDKVSRNVTPEITIMDKSKKVIATIKMNTFIQLTVEDSGNINVKGTSEISRLGSEKMTLTAGVTLPVIEDKEIYMKVDFVFFNRQTQQNEVAESFTRRFIM